MAIYVLKPFDRNTKADGIDDGKLSIAALEVIAGRYEANLGGGIYKKRIPLTKGKSSGARAVIAFKIDKHLFFVNGYAKSAVKSTIREMTETELLLYKQVAKELFNLTTEQARRAIRAGKMREVQCDG
ncbi:type II toxin-antitoxin system RelE/ParE family toxin [Pantoea sp. Seng]|uniref:type II toxin-antitoxin system RelE/ParE family toxin n=1 Tax=Pantoea sp. Seng TaxID=2576761 RepID=UPI00132A3A0B|nr:type II toxin-antitoxin system RelE/ParE family toxin [Pantoea sp. Seng]MXP55096.1 type II toxin-antitoxin system RelE/ParE family toxin [Pantoea sp. Seng]